MEVSDGFDSALDHLIEKKYAFQSLIPRSHRLGNMPILVTCSFLRLRGLAFGCWRAMWMAALSGPGQDRHCAHSCVTLFADSCVTTVRGIKSGFDDHQLDNAWSFAGESPMAPSHVVALSCASSEPSPMASLMQSTNCIGTSLLPREKRPVVACSEVTRISSTV